MNPTELHLGQAYFWFLAALAIAGAGVTVAARNPIRGAMGLLLMILSVAGLFLALHAQFLAAIQLIVYAGAIVVLFLFVIMLLGPSATPPYDHRGRIPRWVSGALFAAAALGAIALVVSASTRAGDTAAHKLLADAPPDFGSVDSFGTLLFSHGLVPFELSSALLMVAIVGAVAVARGRSNAEALEAKEATAAEQGPARQITEEHS
jgi:NADH-quinone oxidoreductase subunit J